MHETSQKSARGYGWGIPASLATHALIAALLIFELPQSQPKQEDKAIKVALVPPEKKPEAPKPEAPKPKPETPQPQPQAEKPVRPKPQPLQTLRPVFRFGEKDAGPRVTPNGGAAKEPETPPAKKIPPAPDGAVVVVPEPKPAAPMTEARKLYSQNATEALAAMTAMSGMPRGNRAGELCASELREQLRHAAPAFLPDLLPSFRLDTGTVMEVPKAAFRAGGQWYDLRFRCEIDADATKVVSFAFDVGAPVPRSEWKSRGFPSS